MLTRRSISRPSATMWTRPSCGSRFSAMSIFPMTLTRETIAACMPGGRLHQVAEHAVDAVADARALLVGLDVDVAGPVADRRQERDVDQVDDRAALDHPVEVGDYGFFELVQPLNMACSADDHHDLFEVAVGRLLILVSGRVTGCGG